MFPDHEANLMPILWLSIVGIRLSFLSLTSMEIT